MHLGAPQPISTGSFPATPVAPAATAAPSIWQKLADFGTQALQTVQTIRQSETLYRINKARLQQGLPPLDQSAIAPQVNVGVAPGTVQSLVTPLLLGGALLFLLSRR